MQLSGLHLKWGHFYDCLDEKRKKVEYAANYTFTIGEGEELHLCSTGAKLAPTGVDGEMILTARIMEAPAEYE